MAAELTMFVRSQKRWNIIVLVLTSLFSSRHERQEPNPIPILILPANLAPVVNNTWELFAVTYSSSSPPPIISPPQPTNRQNKMYIMWITLLPATSTQKERVDGG